MHTVFRKALLLMHFGRRSLFFLTISCSPSCCNQNVLGQAKRAEEEQKRQEAAARRAELKRQEEEEREAMAKPAKAKMAPAGTQK
eukprot:scaffold106937_cov21-Tisochrysis_lutea.AAC.1